MTREQLEQALVLYQTRRAIALEKECWETWAVKLIVEQYDILIAECTRALDSIKREARVPQQIRLF